MNTLELGRKPCEPGCNCGKHKGKTYQGEPWKPNKQDSRKYSLKYYYGLSPEQYMELFNTQGGRCAICGKPDEVLHVDHDHSCCPGNKTCGQCIRGLLCNNCNRGLGMFMDSPAALESAAEYLNNALKVMGYKK